MFFREKKQDKKEEAVEKILDMFVRTKSNAEFVQMVQKIKFI